MSRMISPFDISGLSFNRTDNNVSGRTFGNHLKPKQLELMQKFLLTGNVDYNDFADTSKAMINDMYHCPGNWESVTHNGNIVMTFFVPSNNSNTTVEPTKEQKLEALRKLIPAWMTEAMFTENGLELALNTAYNNQPQSPKTEQYVYCWVKGHVTEYAGFVSLSNAKALLPLQDVNASIVSAVKASFDITPVVVNNVIAPAKNNQVQSNNVPAVVAKPTDEQAIAAFVAQSGNESFTNVTVKETKFSDTAQNWLISFNYTNADGKTVSKIMNWSRLS